MALGLVLSRHRLVSPRGSSRPRGAAHRAARGPGRRLHPAHGVLAQPPALAARSALRDAARARQPPHDDHRAAAAALRLGARGRRERRRAGFATESLHALEAHLDWLERERDVDGDGLITILLPDDSGLDDSPKYDPAYGAYAHYKPGYFRLVARYGRLGWSAHEIAAVHDEHVEDVWVNFAYALSLRAMARLAGDDAYARRADGVEAALLERCLDPATGLFYDLAGRAERPVQVSTWSALSPLMLDTLPDDVRRRLVEEHLLDPRRYRAAFGIPSVAMDEPSFRPGFDRWRTWRGPSWMNVAWLLTPALRDLGHDDDADRIAAGMSDAVSRDACGSTTTRARAPGWRRAASPGRRSWPTSRRRDGRRSRGCSSR
jgi:hypothetical protein